MSTSASSDTEMAASVEHFSPLQGSLWEILIANKSFQRYLLDFNIKKSPFLLRNSFILSSFTTFPLKNTCTEKKFLVNRILSNITE